MMERVSDCCGAEPVGEAEDLGLCPECMDHCTYVDAGEDNGSERDED